LWEKFPLKNLIFLQKTRKFLKKKHDSEKSMKKNCPNTFSVISIHLNPNLFKKPDEKVYLFKESFWAL